MDDFRPLECAEDINSPYESPSSSTTGDPVAVKTLPALRSIREELEAAGVEDGEEVGGM